VQMGPSTYKLDLLLFGFPVFFPLLLVGWRVIEETEPLTPTPRQETMRVPNTDERQTRETLTQIRERTAQIGDRGEKHEGH
jgi:hypothetical protein